MKSRATYFLTTGSNAFVNRFLRLLSFLGSVVALALVVEFAVRLFWADQQTVPTPSAALRTFPALWRDHLPHHVGATVLRTIAGFSLATVIGVSTGVALALSPRLCRFIFPLIDLFRPLPSSALAFVVLAAFGLGLKTYLFVITFGGLWPILINTISGIRNINPISEGVLRQYRIGFFVKLVKFRLPAAAPEIFSGMTISLAICFILTVTAEIILPASFGLGAQVKQYDGSSWFAIEYMIVVIIAVVGFGLNRIFSVLEQWFAKRLRGDGYSYLSQ